MRISSSDAILGWTASNALRRSLLETRTARDLRVIYRASRAGENAATIRWRVVHTLGMSPEADSLELLLDAISGDEDFWVRFGAVRSVIEHAALSQGDALRTSAFSGLAQHLPEQPDTIAGVATWCAMYEGARPEFRAGALKLFTSLRDAQHSGARRDRWQERIDAFTAYWDGATAEAFGSADPYPRRQSDR